MPSHFSRFSSPSGNPGMTNRCKNITLPQTSFAGGKNAKVANLRENLRENSITLNSA